MKERILDVVKIVCKIQNHVVDDNVIKAGMLNKISTTAEAFPI